MDGIIGTMTANEAQIEGTGEMCIRDRIYTYLSGRNVSNPHPTPKITAQ